jgi:hypothetical protein
LLSFLSGIISLIAAEACGVVGKRSLSKRLCVSPKGCPSGVSNPSALKIALWGISQMRAINLGRFIFLQQQTDTFLLYYHIQEAFVCCARMAIPEEEIDIAFANMQKHRTHHSPNQFPLL